MVSESETETKAVKQKVAEKNWIDAGGNIVEAQEEATGIWYKSLADNTVYAYQIPGAVAGSPITMLALFGATTLATNTASANRNSPTSAGKFDSDTDAVKDRLERITDGDWGVERGGAPGASIDTEVLLAAMAEVSASTGKAISAAVIAKVNDPAESAYRLQMKKHSAIEPVYVRLLAVKRGRKEATIDDLFGEGDDEPATE